MDRHAPEAYRHYFENVGGEAQRAVYPLLNDFGRMVMCGMIAEYSEPVLGPYLRATFIKRLRIEGFIVRDGQENFRDWRAFAAPLVANGKLQYREQIVEGLENAPAALLSLLAGGTDAKLVVRGDSLWAYPIFKGRENTLPSPQIFHVDAGAGGLIKISVWLVAIDDRVDAKA